MDTHFELFASIFVDECSTVDGIFLDIYRERDRTDQFRVVAGCGVDDLFDGTVEDSMLISANFDAQTRRTGR